MDLSWTIIRQCVYCKSDTFACTLKELSLHTVKWFQVILYSDGDVIIIIIIIGFLGLSLVMLVLHWLRWYFVGSVGISLVALVFRWLLSPR